MIFIYIFILLMFFFSGIVSFSMITFYFQKWIKTDNTSFFTFEEPNNLGILIVSEVVKHALQSRFKETRTENKSSNLFQKYYLESLMKHGKKVKSKKITKPIFSIFKSDFFGTELIIITRYQNEILVTFVCFLDSFDSTLLFENPSSV